MTEKDNGGTLTPTANSDSRSEFVLPNSDLVIQNLVAEIRRQGLRKVADRAKVSTGAIDGMAKGSRPRLDTFLALAAATGFEVAGVTGAAATADSGSGSDLVPVYLVGAPASAGGGLMPVDDDLGELLGLSERFLRRHGLTPNAVAACDVVGDSMEKPDGTGIRNGTLVLVNTATTPGDVLTGRIYVIVREQDVFIKRLERLLDGTLTMHSDNPRYASETIPKELADQFHVVGEVRAKIERL